MSLAPEPGPSRGTQSPLAPAATGGVVRGAAFGWRLANHEAAQPRDEAQDERWLGWRGGVYVSADERLVARLHRGVVPDLVRGAPAARAALGRDHPNPAMEMHHCCQRSVAAASRKIQRARIEAS